MFNAKYGNYGSKVQSTHKDCFFQVNDPWCVTAYVQVKVSGASYILHLPGTALFIKVP